MPGDDIRFIDWNVTGAHERGVRQAVQRGARDDRAAARRHVGVRARSARGEREKRELAAEIAALLAFSAIKNNDRVGLIIFTDEVEKFVPPKKGKRHVLRVVSEILTFKREEPAHRPATSGSSSWRTSCGGARSRS